MEGVGFGQGGLGREGVWTGRRKWKRKEKHCWRWEGQQDQSQEGQPSYTFIIHSPVQPLCSRPRGDRHLDSEVSETDLVVVLMNFCLGVKANTPLQ